MTPIVAGAAARRAGPNPRKPALSQISLIRFQIALGLAADGQDTPTIWLAPLEPNANLPADLAAPLVAQPKGRRWHWRAGTVDQLHGVDPWELPATPKLFGPVAGAAQPKLDGTATIIDFCLSYLITRFRKHYPSAAPQLDDGEITVMADSAIPGSAATGAPDDDPTAATPAAGPAPLRARKKRLAEINRWL